MQETPSPTAGCKGKGNYERVTLSAGPTSDWVGRGKTRHVMESYPTSDEFFFWQTKKRLRWVVGMFFNQHMAWWAFFWFCFQWVREANISKHPENSPETDVNHWVMKILFVKTLWLCVCESHPCMNLSALLPVENDLNVGVCASAHASLMLNFEFFWGVFADFLSLFNSLVD